VRRWKKNWNGSILARVPNSDSVIWNGFVGLTWTILDASRADRAVDRGMPRGRRASLAAAVRHHRTVSVRPVAIAGLEALPTAGKTTARLRQARRPGVRHRMGGNGPNGDRPRPISRRRKKKGHRAKRPILRRYTSYPSRYSGRIIRSIDGSVAAATLRLTGSHSTRPRFHTARLPSRIVSVSGPE